MSPIRELEKWIENNRGWLKPEYVETRSGHIECRVDGRFGELVCGYGKTKKLAASEALRKLKRE